MPAVENADGNGFSGTANGPVAFDTTRPSVARVYDYWLDGQDNFAADRAQAERMLAVYPFLRERVKENRRFLARAVAWLAGHGIRQFLDVGSGLPTVQNTHQVAQGVDPSCRVAYVDNDPQVVMHATALLSGDGDGDAAVAVEGDLGDPAAILANPEVRRLIRPDEPVAVILAMVLRFFDAATAAKITTAYTKSIAPGSYLLISVGSGDERTGGELVRQYTAGTLYNHSPERIAGFFDGLALIGPGVVDAGEWDARLPAAPSAPLGGHILAGVGRKPVS